MAQTNIKNEILNATITVFNKKGMKFTMDDVAKEAGMSKKTIYAVFSDKQELVFVWLITASTQLRRARSG